MKIEEIVKETKQRIYDYIDMLHIQAVSEITSTRKKESKKIIDSKLMESFLVKRGYTINYVLGSPVMVKDFTCVSVKGDYIEIWHDKTNNNKSVFVNESLLTGLPITLNYMERI